MKRRLTVLCLLLLLTATLVVPAAAEEQLSHVTDESALLTEAQWNRLERQYIDISNRYECGVYAIVVDDYREYGDGDVEDVAEEFYHTYTFGRGSDYSGVLLLLSMEERDYALFVYGDRAERMLDTSALIQVEEEFLPYLGQDAWYEGLYAYGDACGLALAKREAEGSSEPFPTGAIAIGVAVSFLIALIVVLILKSGMKNVRVQTHAGTYAAAGLNLTRRYDQFTHRTVSRTRIQSSSGSSGSRSGGGSSRSGKF